MSEPMIVGIPLLVIGIVIMIGSIRGRDASTALMMAFGSLSALKGAWLVGNELSSGPYRTTAVVVRVILMFGCLVLCVRALRRATHQQEKPSQSL